MATEIKNNGGSKPAHSSGSESVCSVWLAVAVEALENFDCGFWACEGYETKPQGGITCYRCAALHDIYKAYPHLKLATANGADELPAPATRSSRKET